VVASASSAAVVVGSPVQLFANGGGGNGGVTYAWDLGDGVASTLQNPSHTYGSPGSYAATVTARDADGDLASDTVTISVVADDPVVVTSATTSVASGFTPLTVTLTCTAAGNAPLRYTWDLGNGQRLEGAVVDYVYGQPGLYNARCTATDVDGDTDSATVAVTAIEDRAPFAQASVDQSWGEAPLLVSFSSSASGGNGTLAYFWSFGDGSATSTAPSPSYTYVSPGDYVATLTVTDADGDTATAQLSIRVEVRDDPPTASLLLSGSYLDATGAYGLSKQPVFLDAGASQSGQGQDDPGDAVVAYQWSFDSVPVGSLAWFSNSGVANPMFVPDRDGDYVLRVRVWDLRGQVGTASYRLTVESGCVVTLAGGGGRRRAGGRGRRPPRADLGHGDDAARHPRRRYRGRLVELGRHVLTPALPREQRDLDDRWQWRHQRHRLCRDRRRADDGRCEGRRGMRGGAGPRDDPAGAGRSCGRDPAGARVHR
jgi:PKD repeat protein